MKQTESANKGANALQQQHDQHLAHNNVPRRWLALNWQMVALVGGLTVAGGSGVALLLWLANVIEDLGQALNFVAQNTLSLFIFLAVIVQAVISNKQWRAMYDGLVRTDRVIEKMEVQSQTMSEEATATRIAADASVRQVEWMIANERPFLYLRNWGFPQFENGYLILEADFINGGKTPAWEVQGHTRVGVDYEPRPGFAPIPSPEEEAILDGQAFLFIAFNDKVTLPLTPLKITDYETQLVKDRRMKIFVDGVCRYRDSLGGKHFYTYGFTVEMPPGGIHPRYERHQHVQAGGQKPN